MCFFSTAFRSSCILSGARSGRVWGKAGIYFAVDVLFGLSAFQVCSVHAAFSRGEEEPAGTRHAQEDSGFALGNLTTARHRVCCVTCTRVYPHFHSWFQFPVSENDTNCRSAAYTALVITEIILKGKETRSGASYQQIRKDAPQEGCPTGSATQS